MEHTRKKRHEDCVRIRFQVREDTGTTMARPETMNAHAIWRDGCSHPDGDDGDPDSGDLRRQDVGGDSSGDGGDLNDGEGSDPGR